MGKLIFSVDVEPDIHKNTFKSIKEGLPVFEKLCDKYKIKPVLFITGNSIKPNASLFKRLNKKGWELSLHGYSHRRFDDLSLQEKEKELIDSIKVFKKYLGIRPRGFRAPQHSIDNDTLDLLEKHGFEYDSSYTPLNLAQLFFFPNKIFLWFKLFFSPVNPYKIRKNLVEMPCSAFFIPCVSLSFRVLPKPFTLAYVKLLKLFIKKPVFYAHSWDFIALPDSKVDRMFPHTKLLDKLAYIMERE